MSELNDTTQVEYREIPGFPGYYVGDDGSVWSGWRTSRCYGDRLRKLCVVIDRGYPRVVLKVKGKQFNTMSHRLVMLAFVGPPPIGMEVAHNDGNRGNCRLTNLRYDTRKGNLSDRVRHGTDPIGERNPSAKLTPDDVRRIRELAQSGLSRKVIALMFGISKGTTCGIVSRRFWAQVP